MSILRPVQPAYGSGSVNVLGAAGTATVTLPATKQVIITNQGANPAYVRIGNSANGVAAASTSDFAIPTNPQQVVITKAHDDDQLKMLSPAGTTLHVMAGEGW